MNKNRFAQVLYGKVLYIFETYLNQEDLSKIFDPKTYWVDVTNVPCEVGYIQSFKEGIGIIWEAPPASTPTLEELKILKIERLKIERDLREVDKIVYNDNIFDFDDKARERMRIARADLMSSKVSERLWTCADDKVVSLSVLDFDNINSLAATRSEQLHFQYRKLKIVVQQCEALEALEHINFDTDCSHVEVEVTNG